MTDSCTDFTTDRSLATSACGCPPIVSSTEHKGIQGKLLRVRKDCKVVLQLAGMMAVALSGIPMGGRRSKVKSRRSKVEGLKRYGRWNGDGTEMVRR